MGAPSEALIGFQSNSLMIDYSLKASIQIIKTELKVPCLQLYPVSIRFSSRFQNEINTIWGFKLLPWIAQPQHRNNKSKYSIKKGCNKYSCNHL